MRSFCRSRQRPHVLVHVPERHLDVEFEHVVEELRRNRSHDEDRRDDAALAQRHRLLDGIDAQFLRKRFDCERRFYDAVPVGIAFNDERCGARPDEIGKRLRVMAQR